MTTVDQTPDHRAELIANLRALADLLERRPDDMPFGPYSRARLQFSPRGTEAERVAEVHRLAARLGVDVDADLRSVTATLDLGHVEYVVHASTDHGEATYDAELSYRGAVEPDMAGAR
jgi:hypothetical protein